MWRSIEIRNFRSLEHVKATLAPFTVVVGPNSSGKSNFVDAFLFARDIAVDASHAIQNRGGIASIRRWSASRSLEVSVDVRVAATRAALTGSPERHAFTIASQKDGRWVFKAERIEQPKFDFVRDGAVITELRSSPRGRRVPKTLPLGDILATTSAMGMVSRSPALADVRSFRLDTETMRRPQVITERTQLEATGANLAVAVQALRAAPEDWSAVLAAMCKIIPGLTRIEEAAVGRFVGLRFFQRRPGNKEAEFTSTEMSEGALRALAILVAAQQLRPHELLILEEPEVALHPGAAGVLFDALKAASQHGSVLITTHSPELLDAASDEEILVCDYRKGVTAVGPLDQRQRKLVRDGLFSISEIMRAEPLRIDGKRPALVEDD